MDNQLRQIIEEAWNDRALLAESRVREAVRAVIEELDKGRLRTAEPIDPSRSQWQVNEWVKKAILLYFPMQEMRTMRAGELEWHDKMDLKHGYVGRPPGRRLRHAGQPDLPRFARRVVHR